ncbi:hypothetical protein NP233_g10445 [Leucocoprinus birnbaumii]|uniref:Gag-like protein n=1 Tax=Leucocoprinus birnbaumii TaxID=56174 RepID=A0AAD5VKC1_9AGAR|nr:hypothetical protein NP233_g10445 [Leucocoprinus birnbaumii]
MPGDRRGRRESTSQRYDPYNKDDIETRVALNSELPTGIASIHSSRTTSPASSEASSNGPRTPERSQSTPPDLDKTPSIRRSYSSNASFPFPLNQEGLGKVNNPLPSVLSPSLGEMGRAGSIGSVGSGGGWADDIPEPLQKGTLFEELAVAASPMPNGVDHGSAMSAEAVQSGVTENAVTPKPEVSSQRVRTTDFMFCISKVEEYQSSNADEVGAKLVGLAEFFDKNSGYGGGPKWVDPRDLRVGAALWALLQSVFESGWDRLPIDANNPNSPLVIGALRDYLKEGPVMPPADGDMDIDLPESTPITPGNKGKRVRRRTPPAPTTNTPGPSRHQGAIDRTPGSETKVPSTQSGETKVPATSSSGETQVPTKRPAAAVVSRAPPPPPAPKPKASSGANQSAKPEAGPQTPKVPDTSAAQTRPQGMSYASAAKRGPNATNAEPVPPPRGSSIDAGKLVEMARLFPDLEPERLEAMCRAGFGDGSVPTHVPSPTPTQGRGGRGKPKSTTHGPTRRQVLIPFDSEFVKSKIDNFGSAVEVCNRGLVDSKSNLRVDSIREAYNGISLSTNGVASLTDLSTIKIWLTKAWSLKDSNPAEPRLPQSKSFLKIVGVPYWTWNTSQPITSGQVEEAIANASLFDGVTLAARPRIIRASPHSDMSVIWIDVWDSQGGTKAKCLVNRQFNIGRSVATVRATAMHPGVAQCRNCWKWGHPTHACRAQSAKCQICGGPHQKQNHRSLAWCCKANEKANPLRQATPPRTTLSSFFQVH